MCEVLVFRWSLSTVAWLSSNIIYLCIVVTVLFMAFVRFIYWWSTKVSQYTIVKTVFERDFVFLLQFYFVLCSD